MTTSLEQALACLTPHPDYRVIRRLDLDAVGKPPLTDGTVRRAAIIDTETTGTDLQADTVIEIGLVVFEYAAETGQIGPVVGHLSTLEDPGRPIPPESTAIHHITDEMVKDQRFDVESMTGLLTGVSLIIAHNASFDRPFLEAGFPLFKQYPWGCSIRDIPWKDFGFGSSALEFLAYRSGFFYEGHRAEIDCRALLAVLERPLGNTGQSAFHALLGNARKPTLKISALNSPFDRKDLLKARGYRWNPQEKVWARELSTADQATEEDWLREAIYGRPGTVVEVETLDARVRYSERRGTRVRVTL